MAGEDDLLAALRIAGAPPVDEDDLPLLQLIHAAYAPALDALLADHVTQLPLEPDLDPSRAPR